MAGKKWARHDDAHVLLAPQKFSRRSWFHLLAPPHATTAHLQLL